MYSLADVDVCNIDLILFGPSIQSGIEWSDVPALKPGPSPAHVRMIVELQQTKHICDFLL